MPEIQLRARTAAFSSKLSAEAAFNSYGGTAKIISLYSSAESGYGIYLYERTILGPNGRAADEDRLLLTLTPINSPYVSEGLKRAYLNSKGLPSDLMEARFY